MERAWAGALTLIVIVLLAEPAGPPGRQGLRREDRTVMPMLREQGAAGVGFAPRTVHPDAAAASRLR
jgi:hypothetical protein